MSFRCSLLNSLKIERFVFDDFGTSVTPPKDFGGPCGRVHLTRKKFTPHSPIKAVITSKSGLDEGQITSATLSEPSPLSYKGHSASTREQGPDGVEMYKNLAKLSSRFSTGSLAQSPLESTKRRLRGHSTVHRGCINPLINIGGEQCFDGGSDFGTKPSEYCTFMIL